MGSGPSRSNQKCNKYSGGTAVYITALSSLPYSNGKYGKYRKCRCGDQDIARALQSPSSLNPDFDRVNVSRVGLDVNIVKGLELRAFVDQHERIQQYTWEKHQEERRRLTSGL